MKDPRLADQRATSFQYGRKLNEMNVEDVKCDKMIDRSVYSDRLRVTDATERSVKDTVV